MTTLITLDFFFFCPSKKRDPTDSFGEENEEPSLGKGTSVIVIPPNSSTFPDWRRTCHVPLVKSQ